MHNFQRKYHPNPNINNNSSTRKANCPIAIIIVSRSFLFNRNNPSAFMVKFSIWKKFKAQNTTDIVPVQEIHIHPKYLSICLNDEPP